MFTYECDTVAISDVHAGLNGITSRIFGEGYNRAGVLADILENGLRFRRLILNGDIFDGSRRNMFSADDMRFLNVLERLHRRGKEIIWIGGNHDERLRLEDVFVPIDHMREEVELEVGGRRFWFTHGHKIQSDIWSRLNPEGWTLYVVDTFAGILYRFPRLHDWLQRHFFAWRSTAQWVASRYAAVAKERKCDVVCLGHTHLCHHQRYDQVEVMNSGCWIGCESLGMIVIHENGDSKILKFNVSGALVSAE